MSLSGVHAHILLLGAIACKVFHTRRSCSCMASGASKVRVFLALRVSLSSLPHPLPPSAASPTVVPCPSQRRLPELAGLVLQDGHVVILLLGALREP